MKPHNRFFASELIRGTLFETLNKELPYCCEVRIDEFKEPKPEDTKPMIRIKASIYVERDSQKLIVIGKGGAQIKLVGVMARKKLEDFLQSKVCILYSYFFNSSSSVRVNPPAYQY
jgi:GTPase Era involved in 16S rRNA processing